MPFFQVPSSGNDSAEMVKMQNPLFQRALKDDPHFETQVKALELMLKVRDRVVDRTAAVSGATSAKCGLESKNELFMVFAGDGSGADGRPNSAGLSEGTKKSEFRSVSSVHATADELNGNIGLPDGPVSAFSKKSADAVLETTAGVRGSAADATAGATAGVRGFAADATAGVAAGFKKLVDPVSRCAADATAGESKRIISLRQRYESDFPSLNSSGCLGADACASLPAVPGVSARGCSVSSFSAVSVRTRRLIRCGFSAQRATTLKGL